MSDENQTQEEETPSPREEASFLNLRTLALGAAGLIIAIIIVHVIGGVLVSLFFIRQTVQEGDTVAPVPPEPRLQAAPREDLLELRATEQARLNEYALLDQEGSVVRIPIERAIQLLAERGLPVDSQINSEVEQIEADESGFPHPTYEPRGIPAEEEAPPLNLVPTVSPTATPGPSGTPTEDTAEVSPELAQEGEMLFQGQGCNACHTEVSTAIAPTLVGLAGEQVELESGETVVADEAYLRASIINPHEQIVAGYSPIMPDYEDQITEEQLNALIVYIQSLGNDQGN